MRSEELVAVVSDGGSGLQNPGRVGIAGQLSCLGSIWEEGPAGRWT